MLKVKYEGQDSFLLGLRQLQQYLNLRICFDGIILKTEKTNGGIGVERNKTAATIRYRDEHDFWFLLMRLYIHRNEESYKETFTTGIRSLGVMLDCSRNAVLKKESVKQYIVYLALMGYSYLELYTEDTYEIEGEKYFGYMRGRYTAAEIREIDEYAKMFGIELVPCIQTMAHLDCIFKWSRYRAIRDVDNILLLRDERTYALIDKMLKTVAENFTSRKINLGMDEAWLLGSGAFLNKNGYVPREELMLEHLDKVVKMAEGYGFEVSVWNDMFFRIGNGNEYRVEKPYFSPELIERIPQNAKLIYWDYCDEDEKVYVNALENSLRLTKNTGFAGGIYSWLTFIADNDLARRKIKPAVDACLKCGIDDILVTTWGDDGSESSRFSVLPSLCAYGEYCYTQTFDMCDEVLQNLFAYSLQEFCDLGIVNRYVDLDQIENSNVFYGNCAKYMLYNDLLYGVFDNNVPEDARVQSLKNYEKLSSLSKRKSPFSYLFKTMSSLASVLTEKSDLSIDIKRAYEEKDSEKLNNTIDRIEKVKRRLKRFILDYEKQWLKENKPFGFEVQQIRLGGLMERLNYSEKILKLYIAGKISKIDELEEKRLPSNYDTEDTRYNPFVDSWKNIVTCGRM